MTRKQRRRDQRLVKRLVGILKRGGDVRAKVARVKASVRAGIYENELKVSVAVERLMRDL